MNSTVSKRSRKNSSPLLIAAFAALFFAAETPASENQLANNPSPYLALHGADPVQWQPWGRAAIDAAKREDKLLFVSVGYFACHWCHVMQRESYRNKEIAALLNKHFVAVKVDRETHGALDSYLQTFAEETRKQAGWPLNVFITPEGYPLVAVLYEPPQDFRAVLTRLNERWQKERAALKQLALKHPERSKLAVGKPEFAPATAANFRRQLVREALAKADMLGGGFGNTQKFPSAPQLAALLEAYVIEPNVELGEFLQTTLDRMASLGLYDHIGGGFFRYTTDPDWHTPHFEKMLYDNAMLAQVYLRAGAIFKQPEYRSVALRTLDFLLKDLHDRGGAFFTSASAVDGKGREGGVYLWQKSELEKVLSGDEFRLVAKIWQLDKPAGFELGYLPMHLATPTATEQAVLNTAYAKLASARAARTVPKDRKLLTGQNALALSALVEAAKLESKYRPAAERVRAFIQAQWSASGLSKGRSAGAALGPGELEDYAYAAAALNDYAALTQSERDLEFARTLTHESWKRFFTPYGWKSEQTPLLPRQGEQLLIADASTPSPAGTLIETSWKLGGKELRSHALAAANSGHALLNQSVFWDATQIKAMISLR